MATLMPFVSRAHLRIESDGGPTGSRVLVDGKLLRATDVHVHLAARELTRATVTVFPDEIEIVGGVLGDARKRLTPYAPEDEQITLPKGAVLVRHPISALCGHSEHAPWQCAVYLDGDLVLDAVEAMPGPLGKGEIARVLRGTLAIGQMPTIERKAGHVVIVAFDVPERAACAPDSLETLEELARTEAFPGAAA